MLSIASGKGGTGKSVVATNLAVQRARMGERVCLVDFDAGMANAHLLLGVAPRFDLGHVLDEGLEGAKQDRQPLPLLGAADEEQPQLAAVASVGALRLEADVDPVGDDLVVAAVPAPTGPFGGLGDGDPAAELIELATGSERDRHLLREPAGPVGVEGADDRRAAEAAGVPGERRRVIVVDGSGFASTGRNPFVTRTRSPRRSTS